MFGPADWLWNRLRRQGFEALVKALGWVNAVRFLQQYETSRLD